MPLTDSFGQNIPYPTLTDKPNAQTMGQGIVEGLTPKGVMTYASASVRGATITNPRAGMTTWLVDAASMEVYDGAAWRRVSTSTPWTTLSLNPTYWSFDASKAPLPRVRRVGDIVYLEGRVWRAGGASDIPTQAGKGFTYIANIPAPFRPVGNTFTEGWAGLTSVGTAGGVTGRIEIYGDGVPNVEYQAPGDLILFKDKISPWASFHAQWHMA